MILFNGVWSLWLMVVIKWVLFVLVLVVVFLVCLCLVILWLNDNKFKWLFFLLKKGICFILK